MGITEIETSVRMVKSAIAAAKSATPTDHASSVQSPEKKSKTLFWIVVLIHPLVFSVFLGLVAYYRTDNNSDMGIIEPIFDFSRSIYSFFHAQSMYTQIAMAVFVCGWLIVSNFYVFKKLLD